LNILPQLTKFIYYFLLLSNNKVRRLEWAGHLVRMSDDRTVKKVVPGKPDRRRIAGRPKLRWLG
jgi:hypothetical protein